MVAAEEELPSPPRPLGGRHDQLPRRRRPPPLREAGRAHAALEERAALSLSSISGSAPRVPRPGRQQRRAPASARRSRSSKARALGLPDLRGVGAPGEAERARLNLARVQAAFLDGLPAPEDAVRSRTRAARRLHRAAPEARRAARAPAAAPPAPRKARAGRRPARSRRSPTCGRDSGGPRGPRHRALHRLRDEDGRRRDPRLPRARVPRRRPRLRAERPGPQDQPLRRRRRR